MAKQRKFVESDQQREEQLREERKQVEQRVEEELRQLRELIAERRRAANLTREQLAAQAGISPSTVRNIERGRCKSISQETINRLRSVPQLRLPLALDEEEPKFAHGYNAIYLLDYDPGFLSKQAQENLLNLEARMPYSALQHTKEGVDVSQSIISTGNYGKFLSGNYRGILQFIKILPQYFKYKKIDIICLTVGHGWGEIRLVEQILYEKSEWMGRIALVSENSFLLAHGLREFEKRIPKDLFDASRIVPIFGRHSSYINALDTSTNRGRQRIFCILGTFMNLDNLTNFIRNLSQKMLKYDLLLFDIFIPFGHLSNRKQILDEDPRFSQGLPSQYVSGIEESIACDLRAADPSIKAIDWSYGLDDIHGASSNNMETYSVHMNANIHRAHMPIQKVSCMRIHRHDPQLLENHLADYGLTLVETIGWGEEYGVRYPSRILLFIRK